MENIQPALTDFIGGDDFFSRILVVETAGYIPILRERFPMAEIYFVTPDEDFTDARAKVFVLDYREERLPFEPQFFDAIIGDLTLEVVVNPQDIAAGFSTYLKETGVWLTSFRNIRHWQILEKLMRGHFSGIVSRLYTRTDFERLLYASFYKHVRFSPLRKFAPPELLEKLLACGFENLADDLEAEFWLVRAARSMPELSLLKSMYTPEIRAELSRLLKRIEYGVDLPASAEKFWALYDSVGMFTDYVAEFVSAVAVHRERFFENLRASSTRTEIDEIANGVEDFE